MSSWESPFLAKIWVSWATFAVGGGRLACASDADDSLPSLRPAGTPYGLPPVCHCRYVSKLKRLRDFVRCSD